MLHEMILEIWKQKKRGPVRNIPALIGLMLYDKGTNSTYDLVHFFVAIVVNGWCGMFQYVNCYPNPEYMIKPQTLLKCLVMVVIWNCW